MSLDWLNPPNKITSWSATSYTSDPVSRAGGLVPFVGETAVHAPDVNVQVSATSKKVVVV
jgi:hypothetical protein